MPDPGWARPRWRHRLGGALDVLCVILVGWSLLVLLSGGFSFRLLGVTVSARHLANPLLLLGALAIARWVLNGGPRALAARIRRERTVVALLLGVTLLATAVRVPGLFWGYRLFGTTSIPHLNMDEAHYGTGIAVRILNRQADPKDPTPPGLGAQIAFAWYLLRRLGFGEVALSDAFWFFAGRVVALVSGVGTVVLTYFLAREFFRDRVTALFSAYFLALSNLHVTMSHVAKQDGPATFWLYASFYAALVFCRRRRPALLVAAALAAGAAAAMKFVTITLIPLVMAVARAPRKVYAASTVALAAAGAFYLLGGFTFTPQNYAATRKLANLLAPPPYPRLVHVPLNLGFLLLELSLPLFLLAGYAAWRALPRDRGAVRLTLQDDRLPLVLALVVAFVQIVLLRIPSPHYAVILVPFVAMLAARGFQLLGRRLGRQSVAILFGAVTLYLLAHVGSVQYYFVRDTREVAGEWIRRHVPRTEVLSVGHYVFVPPEYRTTPFLDQNYVVLHEDGYRRYVVRNNVHYKFTGRFPEPHEIYNVDRGLGYYPRISQLFRGELPYTLVKQVRLTFLTPELWLARFLEVTPLYLGDTLIFQLTPDREADG